MESLKRNPSTHMYKTRSKKYQDVKMDGSDNDDPWGQETFKEQVYKNSGFTKTISKKSSSGMSKKMSLLSGLKNMKLKSRISKKKSLVKIKPRKLRKANPKNPTSVKGVLAKNYCVMDINSGKRL